MRIIIFFSVLIACQTIYGQTDSIEKAALFKKVQSKEMSELEFSETAKKWNETIEKNKYPDLPVNSDGGIQYGFISEFQEISNEKLFSRILEWFSITYGIIPAYLYSNPEDGKIICSNSLDISKYVLGTYTCILTIKDEKVLFEFTNINFQITNEGYYSGDAWIPEKNSYYTLDQIFPIILKDQKKWAFYLGLISKLNKHFNDDVNGLNDYIINYDLRYQF